MILFFFFESLKSDSYMTSNTLLYYALSHTCCVDSHSGGQPAGIAASWAAFSPLWWATLSLHGSVETNARHYPPPPAQNTSCKRYTHVSLPEYFHMICFTAKIDPNNCFQSLEVLIHFVSKY